MKNKYVLILIINLIFNKIIFAKENKVSSNINNFIYTKLYFLQKIDLKYNTIKQEIEEKIDDVNILFSFINQPKLTTQEYIKKSITENVKNNKFLINKKLEHKSSKKIIIINTHLFLSQIKNIYENGLIEKISNFFDKKVKSQEVANKKRLIKIIEKI